MLRRTLLLALPLLTMAFSGPLLGQGPAQQPAPPATTPAPGTAVATFAGGCFWCVESDFDKVPGVLATVSGYTGGHTPNPTYRQVTHGDTGHYEAVQVTYDPSKVGYERLLERFWTTVDPYDAGGQFCDRGTSYRTAIFVHDGKQRAAAEASKAQLAKAHPDRPPLATPILDAKTFTPAEGYHQDYYQKNPIRYRYYRNGCRRDARVEQLWGKRASN